jgi:hypothetical protein
LALPLKVVFVCYPILLGLIELTGKKIILKDINAKKLAE